jgi:hypothetical protein
MQGAWVVRVTLWHSECTPLRWERVDRFEHVLQCDLIGGPSQLEAAVVTSLGHDQVRHDHPS